MSGNGNKKTWPRWLFEPCFSIFQQKWKWNIAQNAIYAHEVEIEREKHTFLLGCTHSIDVIYRRKVQFHLFAKTRQATPPILPPPATHSIE